MITQEITRKNLGRILPTDPQGKTESTKKELKFLQKDLQAPRLTS